MFVAIAVWPLVTVDFSGDKTWKASVFYHRWHKTQKNHKNILEENDIDVKMYCPEYIVHPKDHVFITGLWRAGPLPSDIVFRWDLKFVRIHVNCYSVIRFFSNDHGINVKTLYRDTEIHLKVDHISPKSREIDWQSLKIKILTPLSFHTSADTKEKFAKYAFIRQCTTKYLILFLLHMIPGFSSL